MCMSLQPSSTDGLYNPIAMNRQAKGRTVGHGSRGGLIGGIC